MKNGRQGREESHAKEPSAALQEKKGLAVAVVHDVGCNDRDAKPLLSVGTTLAAELR